MQPIHIMAIIVRLFAVGLFIYSIERAALIVVSKPAGAYFYLYYLAVFSGLIASILLWIFPTLISKKIVPLKPKSLSHKELNLNDWYRLAFVTLGMYLLLNAISDLFYWLTYLFYLKQQAMGYSFTVDTPENKASIIASFFEFSLAVIFIFSSGKIISLIRSTKVKT